MTGMARGPLAAVSESRAVQYAQLHKGSVGVLLGTWVGVPRLMEFTPIVLSWSAVFTLGVWALLIFQSIKAARWLRFRRNQYHAINVRTPHLHRLVWDGVRFAWKLWFLRRDWDGFCQTHKLVGKGGVTPKLWSVKPTIDNDIAAVVHPRRVYVKGGVDQIKKCRKDIAEIVGCSGGVTVREVSYQAHMLFRYSSTLDRIHAIKTYVPPKGQNRVGYGFREDGQTASFDGLNHILFAGMTGSGKSGALWAALTSLMVQGVNVRLYPSDIKRVELKGYASQVTAEPTDRPFHVIDYANDVDSTVRLIDKVEREVTARQQTGIGSRQWTFKDSEKHPMVLLVFDEMVRFMKTMTSERTAANKKTMLKLETISAEGRALGIFIWGLTQLAQKEVMGDIRDIIPQQLCFAQKNRANVDVVLGDGAAKNGAPAHTIRDKPGYGYSAAENLPDFQPFRAWWCDQVDVDRITKGLLPHGVGSAITVEEERDCSTYVFWAKNGMCLYVGEGYDPPKDRWPDHAGEKGRPAKEWWQYVDHSQTMPPIPRGSKAAALKAEKELIHKLKPLGNQQHNMGNPWRGRYDLLELAEAPQKPRWVPFRPKVVVPVPAKDPEQTWPVLPQTELEFFDQDTAPILFPPDADVVPIRALR